MLFAFRGREDCGRIINLLVSCGYAENKSAVIRRAICEAASRVQIDDKPERRSVKNGN